jgi:hypothetical protein
MGGGKKKLVHVENSKYHVTNVEGIATMLHHNVTIL